MSGVPTSRSILWLFVRKTGWPTCREAYGHGVLIVVDGVTPIQGRRESRLQGEAGQTGELGQNAAEVSRNATVERSHYETAGG